jgi:hypothetical protein
MFHFSDPKYTDLTFQLQLRSFGGTVGLAQCSAVLNAKVKARLNYLVLSGEIPIAEIAQIAGHRGAASLASIEELKRLPAPVAEAIRGAFREGTRWAFLSLIPWLAVAAIGAFFCSNISDTDLRQAMEADNPKSPEEKAEANPDGAPQEVDDPKPSIRKVRGLIDLVVFLYKRVNWGRRQRQRQRGEAAPVPAMF